MAALSAAAPAVREVFGRCDGVKVSGIVTFHASGLPCAHGISVAPSGRFPCSRDRPRGSLPAGICAFLTALQIMSFSCEWRIWREMLNQLESSWSPLASTLLPQMQVCGWHVTDHKRYPTATRIASSESLSPTAVIGGALSQSPACGAPAAFILATSTSLTHLESRSWFTTVSTLRSHILWQLFAGASGTSCLAIFSASPLLPRHKNQVSLAMNRL